MDWWTDWGGPELIDVGADVDAHWAMDGLDYGASTFDVAAGVESFVPQYDEWAWDPNASPVPAPDVGADFGSVTGVIRSFSGIAQQVVSAVTGQPMGPQVPQPTVMQRLSRPIARVGRINVTPLMLVGVAGVAYVATRR